MPISRFGGYFGSNAPGPPTATASFFDVGNNLIGTVDVTIAPNCAWTWNGWEVSGTSISRVEVVSSDFGGAFVQMDDMEILFADDGGDGGGGTVPATSNVSVLVLVTLVLVALGFFIIVGRRKLA